MEISSNPVEEFGCHLLRSPRPGQMSDFRIREDLVRTPVGEPAIDRRSFDTEGGSADDFLSSTRLDPAENPV